MLRGQPAGPSISRQQFLVPKIRKRDAALPPTERPTKTKRRESESTFTLAAENRDQNKARGVCLQRVFRRSAHSPAAGQNKITFCASTSEELGAAGQCGWCGRLTQSVVLWFHRMERRANDKHLSSPFGLGAQIDSAGEDPLRLVAVRRAASCVVVTLTLSLNESTELHRTTSKLELN